jgi:hypothetical protein
MFRQCHQENTFYRKTLALSAIFTTVDKNGMPNAIYVGCVSKFSEDTIVVANNRFFKTQENILSGSKGSILFMSNKGGASH